MGGIRGGEVFEVGRYLGWEVFGVGRYLEWGGIWGRKVNYQLTGG